MMSQENMSNTQKTVEHMSFEDALKELEGIVKRLEAGQGSLETAIEHYERGNNLKAHCEKKLREARLKVDKIIKNSEGVLTMVPEQDDMK